jgi:hypothetical protein
MQFFGTEDIANAIADEHKQFGVYSIVKRYALTPAPSVATPDAKGVLNGWYLVENNRLVYLQLSEDDARRAYADLVAKDPSISECLTVTQLAVATPDAVTVESNAESVKLVQAVRSLNVALAKRILAEWNKSNADAGYPNDWPAQQSWGDLAHSSHCILLQRARKEAGLDGSPKFAEWLVQCETATPDARRVVQRMAAFCTEAINDHCDGRWWQDSDMQEKLEEHGLLVPVVVTEPCNTTHCECSAGDTCYRLSEMGHAVRALAATTQGEG